MSHKNTLKICHIKIQKNMLQKKYVTKKICYIKNMLHKKYVTKKYVT
jgi:hypothetical protein